MAGGKINHLAATMSAGAAQSAVTRSVPARLVCMVRWYGHMVERWPGTGTYSVSGLGQSGPARWPLWAHTAVCTMRSRGGVNHPDEGSRSKISNNIGAAVLIPVRRSEEHTSELQSLMR